MLDPPESVAGSVEFLGTRELRNPAPQPARPAAQPAASPLAIVGIGCRLPGEVDNPEQFWNLVRDGVDGVVDVPADRWDLDSFCDSNPAKVGRMLAPRAGFLKRPIDLFDAAFFGMSPLEAAHLDPQQRMLLEVAWEALEDAGQKPSALAGSRTGVFIGGFMLDSLIYQLSRDNLSEVRSHSATGVTMTMLSARLAYYFDLRGPTITIDTACSSSLVALHYACTSIWNGESEMALAGGVNLMLMPQMSIALAKGKLTSPDGYCKTFDASANGYGRGEGAGMVIIKPLARALAEGDQIYAVVRGTAVNQDGRSVGGITNPRKEAQIDAMKSAYARAGVRPQDVFYVEAHGTGTSAGDTTETAALGSVIGENRSEPFVAGSIKANIGHLEGAAGITGLIKAALSLHREEIAPNIRLNNPNPDIPFNELRLRVATKPEPWTRTDKPRYAGVNSFGYGGTNAHAVLEEAPVAKAKILDRVPRKPWILPLSARSEGALKALVDLIAERIAVCASDAHVEDIVYSAAVRRDHHNVRVAFVADTKEELLQGLHAYVKGESHPAYATKRVSTGTSKKIAWVFTGMGPQWWAMGQELMRSEPIFRQAIEELDTHFKTFGGWSLVEELCRTEESSRMETTEIAMSCNFAIQVGLVALWRVWGLEPDLIVGHSVGEMGAAYASGALTLADAARLAYYRSHIMQQAAGTGRMLATGLTIEEADELVRGKEELVSVAAINGPTNVTLAGDATLLENMSKELDDKGVFQRFLRVQVPFHSPQMEPLKPQLFEALEPLQPDTPNVPLFSTVVSELVTGPMLDNTYWVRNMRESVFFSATVEKLLEDGATSFVEIGPHAVLATSVVEVCKSKNITATIVPSLLRKKAERHTMLLAMRNLYVEGHVFNWAAICAPTASFVRLPTYQWQRERHWMESMASNRWRLGPQAHPFLGHRLDTPTPAWQTEINDRRHPSMIDHNIGGAVLFPASGYLETARAALQALNENVRFALRNVSFSSAFMLGGDEASLLRSTVDQAAGTFCIYSKSSGENGAWTLNSSGSFQPTDETAPSRVNLDHLRGRFPESFDGAQFYTNLKQRGYDYGRTFQQVHRVYYRDEHEFLCEVDAPDDVKAQSERYVMHPATLDACLHAALAMLPEDSQTTYLPVGVARLVCHSPLTDQITVHVRAEHMNGHELSANITLYAPDGSAVVEIEGMRAQAVGSEQGATLSSPLSKWLYTHSWTALPSIETTAIHDTEHWLVLGGCDVGQALAKSGEAHGVKTTHITFDWSDSQGLAAALLAAKASIVTRVISVLDNHSRECAVSPADAVGVEGVVHLLHVLQQLVRLEWNPPPQFVTVTRGAQYVGVERSAPLNNGAISGFMRTVLNEYPEYCARYIDLPAVQTDAEADLLYKALVTYPQEIELVLRDGAFFTYRFERAPPVKPATRTPRQMIPAKDAIIWEDDGFVTVPQLPLEANDVEIHVEASAVRERDMYCVAGRVVRVGAAVENIRRDMRVVAWLSRPLATVIRANAADVCRRPENIDVGSAVALEALCIAHRALTQLSCVSEGDSVLVHDEGQGLGNAIVQVANRLKARAVVLVDGEDCFPSDSTWLRANSPDVRSRVRALTGGHGVDVVLCTRSKHMAQLSELIAQDGCVVDLSAEQPVPAILPRGVTYIPFILNGSRRQARAGPEALRQVLELITNGVYISPTLPFVSLARYEVSKDSRVVVFDEISVPALNQISPTNISREGSYLITGGLGGLGLKYARWLVKRGAGHLILTGRQGAISPQAKEAVKDLEASGACISVLAADVSDEVRLRELLDHTLNGKPPLRGLIHAASTFSSEFIYQYAPDSFRQQMSAKALGAYNLHMYTREMKLDFFVLISSIAAQLGSHGQSAYAASNAFLNSLATYRCARGLPAMSISLGAIGDVGVLNDKKGYAQQLNKVGALPMDSQQAVEATEHALRFGWDHITVAHLDWKRVFIGFPALKTAPAFATFVDEVRSGKQGAQTDHDEEGALRRQLEALDAEQRRVLLVERLREWSAAVFGSIVDKLDPQMPLLDMGMDSLMASQLRDRIERELQIKVRIMIIIRGPSVEQLAHTLMDQLTSSIRPEGDSSTVSTPNGATTDLRTQLGALSPEKQEQILREMRSQGLSVPMRLEHANDELTGEPDLEAEAYLEPSIKPTATWTFTANPHNVFLTGATGFLGAFLLNELLENTTATVWCLVRATDNTAALKRVLDNLRAYELPDEAARMRVKAFCGDLSEPLMGLTPEVFREVAEICEVVYHNGALMNFMYGYDAFIGPNVVGTQEALRLACTGRPKGFHYVSTILMFMLARHDLAGNTPVVENTSSDRGRFALGGYAQSKWVGESLVSQARARGLSATVYRSAIIIGDSRTGAYDPKEAWGRLIKSAVVDQLALDGSVPMIAISVDKAAHMITALSRNQEACNRTFNLAEAEPMDFFPWERLRDAGYPVRVVDNAEFYARLRDDVQQGRKTTLAPLESFLTAKWPGNMGSTFDVLARTPKIETGDAEKLLGLVSEKSAIEMAITASIRRMARTGWIPPPYN